MRNRRGVTPHHIQFRSAGGSDEDHNPTSPCTWCHLHGVHGSRIRATGAAGHVHWELGPRDTPTLIVHGRERKAVRSKKRSPAQSHESTALTLERVMSSGPLSRLMVADRSPR